MSSTWVCCDWSDIKNLEECGSSCTENKVGVVCGWFEMSSSLLFIFSWLLFTQESPIDISIFLAWPQKRNCFNARDIHSVDKGENMQTPLITPTCKEKRGLSAAHASNAPASYDILLLVFPLRQDNAKKVIENALFLSSLQVKGEVVLGFPPSIKIRI